LANEPTPARADRRTNRKLALPPRSACHHQSGYVRARNQQKGKDKPKEKPRNRPRILGTLQETERNVWFEELSVVVFEVVFVVSPLNSEPGGSWAQAI